ncbi:MAG: hypothetical protein JWM64_674 [Frankiales bacterium]|nr:hypothetical protein [Frankiales bacterium]
MELRQLRYLTAVVDHGGFRRAGAALRVAPSALSRSVRQLEQHLGVDLLDRTAGGVQLTQAGREFLAQARSIVEQADAASRSMLEHARGLLCLRIGAVAGALAAGELTVPIMRSFGEVRPDVRVYCDSVPFTDQLAALVAGDVDAAIVRTPVEHPDVELRTLALEPRALLVGRDTDLAQQASVHVDDVLHLPTVRLLSTPGWSRFWQLDDERGGDNTDTSLAPAADVHQMQAAVATGRAVVTTGASYARYGGSTRTRCVSLEGVRPSVIALAVRRSEDRKHVRRFVDVALATARQNLDLLPGAHPWERSLA